MPSSYSLLNQDSKEPLIGGAELQFTMIAKKLIHDFDISFAVYDHGQKSPEKIEGIDIFKLYSTLDFPKKNYLKILYSTFKALKNANSNIYLTRSGRIPPAIIALYCFINRKKFVYSFASDIDVDLDTFNFLELILFKFALNRANLLFTHTNFQKEKLKENFGHNSFIIKSACKLENNSNKKNKKLRILWVSTIRRQWKNPELYLKLASEFPDIQFIMIGGPDAEDPDFYAEIEKKCHNIHNMDFIGFVPYNEITHYFSKASIFVNTSSVEGLPNTFLQSWGHCIPVLSINVNPDNILTDYNLGFHSKTFENMIDDLKNLIEDENLRNIMGNNGRKYVEKEHNIKIITNKYKKLLKSII
jgi:glycosyltransferase involved in cell wall biosynthesis